MQIDRARFLLLTASLAGGGCSATASSDVVTPPTPAPTASEEVVVPETPEPDETTTEVAVSPSASATTESQPPSTTGCDNDTGAAAACSISGPPGPFCEGLTDARAACKGFKQALRGKIAAKAVSCLNAASGTLDVCGYAKSESCVTEAVRGACIQPSTFNACSPVVSTCASASWNKLTMQDCQALLSSVKDGKRAAMITCMTEGCSLESCSWSLR